MKCTQIRQRFSGLLATSLVSLLVSAPSVWATITVDGVTDKKVYADRVTFTVRSEAGSDFTATLNGVSVAVGVAGQGR